MQKSSQMMSADYVINNDNNDFEGLREPFVSVRRTIEKIFGACQKLGLIPPISNNMNSVAYYFRKKEYSEKDKETNNYVPKYRMKDDIMPMTLALSLSYIVNLTQDASHSKNGLMYKVDEYYRETKDYLMLRSVVYILLDVLKWFCITALQHSDIEINKYALWKEIKNEPCA